MRKPTGFLLSSGKLFTHSTSASGITCPLKTKTQAPSAFAYFSSANATTNYGNGQYIRIGESNAATDINRAWVKPPAFSTLPNGSDLVGVSLKLYTYQDLSSNARVMRAHRCLRSVLYSTATWQNYDTGLAWGSPGASNSSNDYDGAVELGNVSIAASPTQFTEYVLELDVTETKKIIDGTYTNNGIVLFVDTQSSDLIVYQGGAAPESPLLYAKFVYSYF